MRLAVLLLSAVLAAAAPSLAAPAEALALSEARAAMAKGEDWAALRLLEPLAAKGDIDAMVLLGSILAEGKGGVARNPIRAMQLIRRAAEAGNADAQHLLARAYATGAGVSRSAFQAHQWLTIAAANSPADKRKAILAERDSLAAELTSGELDQAVAMAERHTGANQPLSTPSVRTPPAPHAPIPLLPSPAVAQTQPKKVEAVVTPRKRSVGTGIVVGADGKILTNAHVVPACRAIRVTLPDGSKLDGTLVRSDERNDLALLQLAATDLETARLREGKPIRAGDGVVVVGFPLSSYLSREPNVTVGVVSAMAGRNGDKRYLQITAPVQKGNSGGPLADMSGNIIGIVATKLDAMKIAERTGDLPQNVNFAIKADLAAGFLSDQGVTVPAGPAGPDQSAADVGERIKRVTVFIECER